MRAGMASRLSGYLLAVFATAVAALVRWLLDPWLGSELPFLTLYFAVMVSAWLGGLWPCLLAVTLGFLAGEYFFSETRYALWVGGLADSLNALRFLLVGVAFGLFSEAMGRGRVESERRRELLRVTLASIGDGVITTDTQGRITYLNAVAESLTGWTLAEAAGRPLDAVFRIISEQTRLPAQNPAVRALREGRVVGLANHTVLIPRDGTERVIDDSAAPIRDEHGQVTGCVLVFRDITERRRLERQSMERGAAARFLASIVESSDDAIIGKSLDGYIQSWNGAAERLYGCPADQAVGRHISIFIPADRVDEENRILARLRAGERIDHFDTVRVRGDGRPIHVSLTVSPIRDEAGQIVGASKIARDITERKRAEGLLRLLSEAAQHLLAAADPDEMVRGLFEKIKGPLGTDAYFNCMMNDAGDGLRLESYAGIPEETACSIDCPKLEKTLFGSAALHRQPIHATDLQNSEDALSRPLKTLGFRVCYSHPLLVNYRLLGTLSFASRGKDRFTPDELGFLGTVSQYVTTAYERLRLIGRLRDEDRRKDEFLATLAHELRNPLAPLSNMLQILKRSEGDARALRQARDTMERQLRQMVRLVDDLLDVSRITRDRLELRKERVQLASVVDEALETVRPLLESADHQLTVSLPPEPIDLHADPVRLAQIFGNLLTNACKYTEPGGRIELAAERQGSDVIVKVKDTGIGIPADKLAGIFDMFSQVHSALEHSQGGLGIGLTLVKRLVEMHGGAVEAKSEGPGRGCEFVVRLPALIDSSSAEPPSSAAEPVTSARRILIVDDNQDSAASLAMLLQLAGNQTHTAHDGLDAVEAAERFRPDVVLLDIGLPRLNGYEVCRRIREQAWGRTITLVALTGWGQDEDRRKSQEAGFDQHLVKPLDYPALMKLLTDSKASATLAASME